MTDLRLSPMNEGGHGDATAYLLGALDEAARARFEAHAAGCDECLRELEALQPVADRLALAVPQVEPPAHLASSVVAAARAVSGAVGASLGLGAVGLEAGWGAPAAEAPAMAARQRRRGWIERASLWVAAASMLVAVGGTGYALAQRQEMQHTAQTASALSETLSVMYQPGVVWRAMSGAEGAPQAKGRIYLTPDGVQGVLMTYDMPRPQNGRAYQLWLNNPDANKRDSGGVFQVDDKGRGHLIVKAPAPFESYKACGVTEEPISGSKWPTGTRALTGQL